MCCPPTDIDERIEVIKRRDAYENDHEAFIAHWQSEDATSAGAHCCRARSFGRFANSR